MAAELLKEYEPEIETVTLIPAEGGRFEVVVNDHLLYSKLATGRHANPGEVHKIVKQHLSRGNV